MGRPLAATVRVRRRLLAILAAADEPMSTPDLLIAMAGRAGCNSACTPRGCPFSAPCPAWCWHQSVYPQLRAMVRLGLVQHIRIPSHRCVYWRGVDNETDEAMNRLLDEGPAELDAGPVDEDLALPEQLGPRSKVASHPSRCASS